MRLIERNFNQAFLYGAQTADRLCFHSSLAICSVVYSLKRKVMSCMTDKQRKFADEYLIDCNATRAYKAAYPHIKNDRVAKVNGSRLLTNANLKAYIDERLDEISSEKIADAAEVMKYLTSVLRGESTAEIVVVEGVGDGMSEARSMTKKPDETQRLKAAELLGKRYGLFKDNVKLEGAVPVIIKDDIPETDD